MNDKIDDAIERLLREAAPDPVADEGFCADLIERLPPHRPRAKWPLAVGIVAGMLACWFSVGSAQVSLAGWHDLLSGDLTSSALVLLISATGLSLLTLAWTLAEAHEQAL
jgi:hypothetical protein